MTDLLTDAQNLQNTFTPKPWELGTWHFETMITTPCVSCNMCHMSPVKRHMSCVRCHESILKKKRKKVVELVGGGSVINRATPYSLEITCFLKKKYWVHPEEFDLLGSQDSLLKTYWTFRIIQKVDFWRWMLEQKQFFFKCMNICPQNSPHNNC